MQGEIVSAQMIVMMQDMREIGATDQNNKQQRSRPVIRVVSGWRILYSDHHGAHKTQHLTRPVMVLMGLNLTTTNSSNGQQACKPSQTRHGKYPQPHRT